ncbi:MAG: ORF6C domain-containing protein [Clostridiaceae bacterium]
MNNLITITEKDNRQIVSAKELYLGLGLRKQNWARWYPTNIEQNEFFNENIDWVGVPHSEEGNETMDFAISLEFAKHIAMMARTEKSHEYRNYFIECEKQIQAPQFNLSKELKAIFTLDEKTQIIEGRIEKLENTMTIDYSQQEEIRSKATSRVVEILGGKDVPAYKELNKKAFSQIWKDYKRALDVNSYRNTAVKDFDKGLKFVTSWKPTRELELMIMGSNSQMRI